MNDLSANNCKQNDVLRLAGTDMIQLSGVLANYGLSLKTINTGSDIPGSFWGDEEAGLIGDELLVRNDTPVHSILHEACHYVCMDKTRRAGLHTDAGGDYDEESAVCYLQILLADKLAGYGRQRIFRDMDLWGYTFRLGSARAWFENDADDARKWLRQHALIDKHCQPNWQLR